MVIAPRSYGPKAASADNWARRRVGRPPGDTYAIPPSVREDLETPDGRPRGPALFRSGACRRRHRGKRLQTTAGTPEQRETPLQNVSRNNGTILIQGVQGERAFSWLITETSGEGTLSVAGVGQGVTVFTVCTAVDKL